jgi:hypothetical protein
VPKDYDPSPVWSRGKADLRNKTFSQYLPGKDWTEYDGRLARMEGLLQDLYNKLRPTDVSQEKPVDIPDVKTERMEGLLDDFTERLTKIVEGLGKVQPVVAAPVIAPQPVLEAKVDLSTVVEEKQKKKRNRKSKKTETGPVNESVGKCSKECKGQKVKKNASGVAILVCECKLEAKQPNAFATMLAPEAPGYHFYGKQFKVTDHTGLHIGNASVYSNNREKFVLFNKHFVTQYKGASIEIPNSKDGSTNNEPVRLMLTLDKAQVFKNTDVVRSPLVALVPEARYLNNFSAKFCVKLGKYDENNKNNIYLFTAQYKADGTLIPICCIGANMTKQNDVSGSYHHFNGKFYSEGGYCGGVISTDMSTMSGMHYHTSGEGNGNEFMGFTNELYDFLLSQY